MKPIKVNDAFRAKALEEFNKVLESYTATEGPLSFKMDLGTLKDTQEEVTKPIIQITADAYLKMMSLVLKHSQEICWHGLVTREDNVFKIHDILCYPQTTTAVTVEMDEDAYIMWHMELEDDVVNSMHMQGHSHVNMTVTPSSTDLTNWEDFRKGLKDDGFFIFCIANKKSEINWWIYDHATNWVYEPTDISTEIIDSKGSVINEWTQTSLTTYVKEAPKFTTQTIGKATTQPPYRTYGGYGGYSTGQDALDMYDYDWDQSTSWDEEYDDEDLDVSRYYLQGYRWSSLRNAYIKVKAGIKVTNKNKNKNKRGRVR